MSSFTTAHWVIFSLLLLFLLRLHPPTKRAMARVFKNQPDGAMKQCKSCASDIRAEASVCPVCKKKQGMGLFQKIGLAMIAFLVVAAIVDQQAPPKPVRTPEQIAADQKKTALRMRVNEVKNEVKSRSKNPDSFKLVGAGVTADETVCITYRGTNSFNAVVPGVAYERNGIVRFDQEGFARHCLKPSLSLQDLM
jgi:hypothetical protein